MPKFRKKPIIIEAEQWLPGKSLIGVYGDKPGETCPCYKIGGNHNLPHVMTAHNQIVHLTPGDWIVLEANQDDASIVKAYPIKPSVFDATYEAVE